MGLFGDEKSKKASTSHAKKKPVPASHGGKTGGKVGMPKRMAKKYDEKLKGPSIRRLARRSGIKRISGTYYDGIRTSGHAFLKDVCQKAMLFMENAKRKTLTAEDVVHALRELQHPIYQ